MKQWPNALFRRPETRSLAVAVAVAVCWLAVAANGSGQAAHPASTQDLFPGSTPLRVAIQIEEAGLEKLRHAHSGQRNNAKPRATARVSEGGKVYANVRAQLKGFSSFSPVDERPSLTLHFDKGAEGGLFHGLDKISLNNSSQDSTRLQEKFAREVFAAAGVPVPRADYALVSLNGRNLGLYVLVEGYDKRFLKRHFQQTDGNLYDGGTLQDIDRQPQLTSGNPGDHRGIERLLRASREADPARRHEALAAALDLDRFFSMVAIETMLCHSDSYSMNRNNYRLYHDPATDKMVFMPHGMDRVMGDHRSGMDLTIVPPMLGLVARAALSTPAGRRQYLERAGQLFTNVFQPDRLVELLRASTIKVAALRPDHERNLQQLSHRLHRRAADLRMQFSHWDEIIHPVPVARFDEEGNVPLPGWRVYHQTGRADPVCEAGELEGRPVWLVRLAPGATSAPLRCALNLPAGQYQLSGRVMLQGPDGLAPSGNASLTLLRYSSDRFGADSESFPGSQIRHSFRVSAARAPEEMELFLELRPGVPEVRLDTSLLRLIKVR